MAETNASGRKYVPSSATGFASGYQAANLERLPPASTRREFRFSGEGGQGVILGGAILAEAAILHAGRYAVQSPQYGSRVRGGPTKVDVIIADAPILFPRATRIDFFLALAQMAYDKYARDLADEAVLLVDDNLVPEVRANGHLVYRLPIVEIAKVELGNEVLSNSVALGAVVALTGIVGAEAVWRAIENRVPPKARQLNRQAFERGLGAGAGLRGAGG